MIPWPWKQTERRRVRRLRHRPLLLEPLEDRCLLSGGRLFDNLGTTFATANVLTLVPGQPFTEAGSIARSGGVELFKFIAPQTGALSARQFATSYSSLDSFLTAYDAAGTVLASNDNNGGTLDSALTFHVVAGASYYLEAAASPSAAAGSDTGNYALSIAPYTDDVGNTFATAQALALAPFGPTVQRGTIEVIGDVDVFKFVAPLTTGLAIRQDSAPGSKLDSELSVFDAAGNQLAENDDSGSSLNSALSVNTIAGQTYYVRASASLSAIDATDTGAYVLTLQPFADPAGSTPATALALSSGSNGSTTESATIGVPGDVDVYRLNPTVTGPVSINLHVAAGSVLNSQLAVLDANGNALASDVPSASTPIGSLVASGAQDSRLIFDATAGQPYFVRAASQDASSGGYTLTISPFVSPFGSTLATASPLSVGPGGTTQELAFAAQTTDVFRFTAASSTALAVRLDPADGSVSVPTLTVRDSSGNVVVTAAPGGSSSGTRAVLDLLQGQTYYVQLSSAGSAGYVRLTLQPYADDFGNSIADAAPLQLSSSGSDSRTGTLEVPGDVDFFRFVAPLTGNLILRQDATPGSSLDSYLTVFDATGKQIALDDDSGGMLNSRLLLPVVQGQTYYAEAAAYPYADPTTAVGGYLLSFAVDNVGHTLQTAQPLTVAADGSATQAGQIEVPGDVDFFRYDATTTGSVVIHQDAAGDGTLDSVLTVFDASGKNQLAQNDDASAATLNSTVTLSVSAGQTYFIQAAGYTSFDSSGNLVYGSTGAYVLTVAPVVDDFGNTPATAHTLTVAADGSATQTGQIEVPGDVDYFRYVAATTGGLVIHEDAAASSLDSVLTVLTVDASGTKQLAQNDDSGGTLNSTVTLSVSAGQTYFIQAGAYPGSTGAYVLTVAPVVDDFGNTPATAHTLTVAADGSATQTGQIEVPGDVDFFRYDATTTGSVVVHQDAAGDGTLDSVLTVFDASGTNQLAQNDDSGGTLNSTVALSVTAGQTYYIQAAGYSYSDNSGNLLYGSTGAYAINIFAYPDDAGNTTSTARALTLAADGSLTQAGHIEVPGDTDFYRITPTASEQVTVQLAGTDPSNFLDGYLQVLDANGNVLASSDDDGISINRRVTLNLQANQTYYFEASASSYAGPGQDSGSYRLSVEPVATIPASPFALSADGFGVQQATFAAPGETNTYSFVAPFSGQFTLSQHAAADSALESALIVSDASGTPLGTNQDPDGTAGSTVTFFAAAGQTLYVRATDIASAGGAYLLSISPSALSAAPLLSLTADGNASQDGSIDQVGDVNTFSFVAPFSGALTLTEAAAVGSSLDSQLSLLDEYGNEITANDNRAPGDPTSSITIAVVAGQTYYALAAGAGASTGAYTVTVAPTPDEAGDTTDTATDLPLSSNALVQSGFIGSIGDVDTYRYVAPTSGQVYVSLTAPGDLFPNLTVLDADGNALLQNTAGFFNASAGQVYYFQIAADPSASSSADLPYYDPEVGQYQLTYGMVTPLTVSAAAGDQVFSGDLLTSGASDVYSFVASSNTTATFRQVAAPGSGLNSFLRLLDASGNSIASNDDSGGTLNSTMMPALTQGQTYYLVASSSPAAAPGADTGAYRLHLEFGPPVVAPDAPPATIYLDSSSGAGYSSMTLQGAAAQQTFQFRATMTGRTSVYFQGSGGSGVADVYLFNATNQQLGSMVVSATGGANVTFQTIAGQTYYLRAETSPFSPPGSGVTSFFVTVAPGSSGGSNFGNAPELPVDPSGTGSQLGSLLGNGDTNVYSFTATAAGQVNVSANVIVGSASTTLTGFDGTAVALASARQTLGFNVAAGQTYFVAVADAGGTGKYNLNVDFEADVNVPTPTPSGIGEAAVFEDNVGQGDVASADGSQRNVAVASAALGETSTFNNNVAASLNLTLFTQNGINPVVTLPTRGNAAQVADLQPLGEATTATVAILLSSDEEEQYLPISTRDPNAEPLGLLANLEDFLAGAVGGEVSAASAGRLQTLDSYFSSFERVGSVLLTLKRPGRSSLQSASSLMQQLMSADGRQSRHGVKSLANVTRGLRTLGEKATHLLTGRTGPLAPAVPQQRGVADFLIPDPLAAPDEVRPGDGDPSSQGGVAPGEQASLGTGVRQEEDHPAAPGMAMVLAFCLLGLDQRRSAARQAPLVGSWPSES